MVQWNARGVPVSIAPADVAVPTRTPVDELQRCGIRCTLREVKRLQSSVTTAWGVDWSDEYIARDLLQNFYDANKDRLGEVKVGARDGAVVITGPASCSLEQLFFLGSEKDPDQNIGQYGEGFKAAAVCLLRDHDVTPIAVSDKEVLVIGVADAPVDGTRMYPLNYVFYSSEEVVYPGTLLLLPGCRQRLVTELQAGLTHFLYAGNALLGPRRWQSYNGKVEIYDSRNDDGYVFYRRLRRASLPGLPLAIVVNQSYVKLEKLIASDRDRNAFGEKLRTTFYDTFAASIRCEPKAQRVVIEAASHRWVGGHPLLSAIAQALPIRSYWTDRQGREVFGDKYYSCTTSSNPVEQARFDYVERQWREDGRTPLPGYFRYFGVPSADRYLERQAEEANRAESRTATDAERASMVVLVDMLSEFAPLIHALFAKGDTKYSVVRTDAALGELRRGRAYNSRDVFLAEQLFVGDFAQAAATFLHEHAHVFGYDASRGFTDALTELIESVVRHRQRMDEHETRWNRAVERVRREREAGNTCTDAPDAEWRARLASMTPAELRDVLQRVPAVVLRKLLELPRPVS